MKILFVSVGRKYYMYIHTYVYIYRESKVIAIDNTMLMIDGCHV